MWKMNLYGNHVHHMTRLKIFQTVDVFFFWWFWYYSCLDLPGRIAHWRIWKRVDPVKGSNLMLPWNAWSVVICQQSRAVCSLGDSRHSCSGPSSSIFQWLLFTNLRTTLPHHHHSSPALRTGRINQHYSCCMDGLYMKLHVGKFQDSTHARKCIVNRSIILNEAWNFGPWACFCYN